MLGKQSPHGTWRGPYVALRWEQAAIAGAAAVFLALALPQVGRPLIYDEVDFAKAARAVAGGSFRYDRGYIADYAHAPDRGERYQLALFHPPGYLLALAAWQRPAGSADAALRTFGVACGLASLAAAVVLGRIAGGGAAAAWAAVLWATAPYAVQSALLLDIDGTVLPPLVGAGAAAALAAAQDPGRRYRWWGAAALLAAGLWCKLTTPLVAVLGLAAWLLACRRPGDAGRLLAAAAAGGALFGASWGAFAAARGLPVERPFLDLLDEAADAVRTAAGAPRESAPAAFPALFALVSLLRTAQWLHPLLVGLLVAAPLAFRRLEPAAALLVAAGATLTLDLVKLAAGFPKYHAGVFPLVAAAAGAAGAAWLRGCPGWPAYALAGAALGGAATLATGGDALIHHADLNLLAAWLAAAAACLVLARLLGGGRPAALALGLLVGANVATSARQIGAAGATAYFYGVSGQVAAGAWLRAEAQPGEVVAADREVAYYAGPVHFVDSERFAAALGTTAPAPAGRPTRLVAGLDAVDAAGIRLFVTKHDQFAARLPPGSRPVATFGAYQAWEVGPSASRQ